MRSGSARPRAEQNGFALLALLASVVLVTLAAEAAGTWLVQQQQRERERALLHIGALYAKALAEYKRRSPGSLAETPRELQDLLLDARFVGTVRTMRRLYPDPLQPDKPWGLVRDLDGHILGVYSQSGAAPIASRPHAPGLQLSGSGRRYSDWKFLSTEIVQ